MNLTNKQLKQIIKEEVDKVDPDLFKGLSKYQQDLFGGKEFSKSYTWSDVPDKIKKTSAEKYYDWLYKIYQGDPVAMQKHIQSECDAIMKMISKLPRKKQ